MVQLYVDFVLVSTSYWEQPVLAFLRSGRNSWLPSNPLSIRGSVGLIFTCPVANGSPLDLMIVLQSCLSQQQAFHRGEVAAAALHLVLEDSLLPGHRTEVT